MSPTEDIEFKHSNGSESLQEIKKQYWSVTLSINFCGSGQGRFSNSFWEWKYQHNSTQKINLVTFFTSRVWVPEISLLIIIDNIASHEKCNQILLQNLKYSFYWFTTSRVPSELIISKMSKQNIDTIFTTIQPEMAPVSKN